MNLVSFDAAQQAAIRGQLERLVASVFASAPRRGQLLRYLVERALCGDSEKINEYSIGIDVFEKPPSFDPRIESIVRTEAGRLRQKLKEYFAGEGLNDPVSIEIPLRSYRPAFDFRTPEEVQHATLKSPTPGWRIPAGVIVAALLLTAAAGLLIWNAKSAPDRPQRFSSTDNLEALALYRRANYEYAHLEPASLEKSIGLFQAAIKKDPAYARAYVGLAQAEMELTNFRPRDHGFDRARVALQTALKLDPDFGDAHGLLAGIQADYDGDWPGAQREFQLAIKKGAQPSTRAAYGWGLAKRCNFTEAQIHCSAAQNLEPLGIAPRFCQFYVYYYQRRYSDARRMLRETLEMNPRLIYSHWQLALVALLEHDCDQAARQFDDAGAQAPASVGSLVQAYTSACRGETDQARKSLLKASGSGAPPSLFEVARGYSLLHDDEAALTFLERSAAAGEPFAPVLREPFFDTLRRYPRYADLVAKAGLAACPAVH